LFLRRSFRFSLGLCRNQSQVSDMTDSSDTLQNARPISIEIVLLEGKPLGPRTARVHGRTCRVTLAPAGRAQDLARLAREVDDGGVILSWSGGSQPQEVQVRPAVEVRSVLAETVSAVAVVTNDYQLLPPPAYEALANALRGTGTRELGTFHEALAQDLEHTARILLAALHVPGSGAAPKLSAR